MKKLMAFALATMMVVSLAACGGGEKAADTPSEAPATEEAKTEETAADDAAEAPAGDAAPAEEGGADATEVTAGVCIYKYDDTFMSGVRDAIQKRGDALGAKINMSDSQNSQPTQNDQVQLYLTQGANVLILNPVDRTAAGTLIDNAKGKDVPVVFINREPLEEDMAKWDRVYYVGAKAEDSGTIQGEIIVDYFKANPDADLNGDGKIQYALLTGEPGHQDAELRSEYVVKAMTDGGFEVESVAEDTAMWDRVKGQEKMAAFLTSTDNIEVVIANNDDMALGAIEALKAAGYFGADGKYMPVVGVDATSPAIEAVKDGTMLGTVLNDSVNQGTASVNVAVAAAQGKEITSDSIGYEMTGTQYVWIPYVKVVKENVDTMG